MLKIKIFDEEHEKDLEDEVNLFLETIEPSDLKQIQYQVAVAPEPESGTIFCFSAMILYET
ncbi:uncharacterized protein DUF2758 [Scopulibacillus darangshiensis]|uniref:Uncharacterized protein DUF2758 n=1 Tax=Scopulibacillus darangshiensis TaxID=442528 RepID=A0A4V2SMB3_9BACL|nr:sporulation protein Cse60 [Scopulibacillus darangshiensis]TCP26646.1 uncharacterized protein DUF2758 [Scopulibacillus darangshiensis]